MQHYDATVFVLNDAYNKVTQTYGDLLCAVQVALAENDIATAKALVAEHDLIRRDVAKVFKGILGAGSDMIVGDDARNKRYRKKHGADIFHFCVGHVRDFVERHHPSASELDFSGFRGGMVLKHPKGTTIRGDSGDRFQFSDPMMVWTATLLIRGVKYTPHLHGMPLEDPQRSHESRFHFPCLRDPLKTALEALLPQPVLVRWDLAKSEEGDKSLRADVVRE